MSLRWIKVNETLPSSAAALGLAVHMDTSVEEAIGHLVKVLLWADLHVNEDGTTGTNVPMLSRLWGDRCLDGLRAIGWIEVDGDAVRFCDWSRHNGESAKARAEAARKKGRQRAKNGDVPPRRGQMSPKQGDKCPPKVGTDVPEIAGQKRDQRREEKRRREETEARAESRAAGAEAIRIEAVREGHVREHLADADRVFDALPRRVQAARTRFRRAFAFARLRGQEADAILGALRTYYASPQGSGEFHRTPHRFLEDEGWREPPEAWGGRGKGVKASATADAAVAATQRMLAEQRAHDARVLAERQSGRAQSVAVAL